MSDKRISNEDIITAYKNTGSIWKAGKELGIAGQIVWEKLKKLNYTLLGQHWSVDEIEELKRLVTQCTIGEIANRLGRPYAGVALKISRLGLGENFGNKQIKKIPRGSGFNKKQVVSYIKELKVYSGSLKQFCRKNSISIDSLVYTIQKNDPEFWVWYTKTKSKVRSKQCPYCKQKFYPMSKKQKTCTRKCSGDQRRDNKYFGGKRRTAYGLAEGRCQLCKKEVTKGLSAHHILGKENDPENDHLIALCRGCHEVIGLLATRLFVDDPFAWQDLISLVLLRKAKDINYEVLE